MKMFLKKVKKRSFAGNFFGAAIRPTAQDNKKNPSDVTVKDV